MALFYVTLFVLIDWIKHPVQASFESWISLSPPGMTFTPKHSIETPLDTIYLRSLILCGKHCNQNPLCRTFVYDRNSSSCQLYQSDSQTGNITCSSSITSVVGQITYTPQLYLNYNKTCDQCEINRYLTCRNGRCQCPLPTTYWDGQMCRNQLYFGEPCNQSNWCRNDLNLSCVFGSCQPSTALCKLGATPITFDDIPNRDANQGLIPSGYRGFTWTNGKYLNATAYTGSGYVYAVSSGEYISWFNSVLTLQIIAANQNFTLNSCIMSAAWADTVSVTITGYYLSTQLYTTTVSLNTYTKVTRIFDWSGLTRVVFNPYGGWVSDTGMDNICITY